MNKDEAARPEWIPGNKYLRAERLQELVSVWKVY